MNDKLSWNDIILNNKSVFPIARRALNFVMILSVTAFYFEKHFGVIDYSLFFDKIKVIEYLLKGLYIIPLSIAVVVYVITEYLAQFIFFLVNYFLSLSFDRKILQSSVSTEDINAMLNKIENVSNVVTPVTLTPELLKRAYLEIRKNLSSEIIKLETEVKKDKNTSESNFIFWFRILLTSIFYLTAEISGYGWVLFISTAISMIVLMVFSIFHYQTLNIIPTALRKFHFEAEKYLVEELRSKNSVEKK